MESNESFIRMLQSIHWIERDSHSSSATFDLSQLAYPKNLYYVAPPDVPKLSKWEVRTSEINKAIGACMIEASEGGATHFSILIHEGFYMDPFLKKLPTAPFMKDDFEGEFELEIVGLRNVRIVMTGNPTASFRRPLTKVTFKNLTIHNRSHQAGQSTIRIHEGVELEMNQVNISSPEGIAVDIISDEKYKTDAYLNATLTNCLFTHSYFGAFVGFWAKVLITECTFSYLHFRGKAIICSDEGMIICERTRFIESPNVCLQSGSQGIFDNCQWYGRNGLPTPTGRLNAINAVGKSSIQVQGCLFDTLDDAVFVRDIGTRALVTRCRMVPSVRTAVTCQQNASALMAQNELECIRILDLMHHNGLGVEFRDNIIPEGQRPSMCKDPSSNMIPRECHDFTKLTFCDTELTLKRSFSTKKERAQYMSEIREPKGPLDTRKTGDPKLKYCQKCYSIEGSKLKREFASSKGSEGNGIQGSESEGQDKQSKKKNKRKEKAREKLEKIQSVQKASQQFMRENSEGWNIKPDLWANMSMGFFHVDASLAADPKALEAHVKNKLMKRDEKEAKLTRIVKGGDDGKFKYCQKCQKTLYCSKECQVADWPNHKLICPWLKRERTA